MAKHPAPFHAMSQLSTGLAETAEGSAVNMTDEQLAGVEGGFLIILGLYGYAAYHAGDALGGWVATQVHGLPW